jgi:hypothetical protein
MDFKTNNSDTESKNNNKHYKYRNKLKNRDVCDNNDISRLNGNYVSLTKLQGTYPNNWSPTNVETLRNWKISLSKAAYIYQHVLDLAKHRLNRILVISAIISFIATIISGVATTILTVDNPNYKMVALIINGLIFILETLVTLLTFVTRIYKFDETVSQTASYITKIDEINSKISNELILPDLLREDAVTFIKRENEKFLKLIQESPDIEKAQELAAIKEYNEFIEDNALNFKLAQKYNNDAIIEVV